MRRIFRKIYGGSLESYKLHLKENLINQQKTFVVTANPEALMIAERDEEYRKMLLDNKTEIVPDGIGLVKACKKINIPVTERIPGIELAESLLISLNELKKSLYLFGAKQEIIDDMKKMINNKYPGIKLVGTKNGYVKDKNEVFDEIFELNPDVILVALGMPLQEKLIYKNIHRFNKGIFIGVGGSFDVMSGNKKRAPKFFQKLNIEWLYRICCEPSRLKRFWNNNVKFLINVRKYK